MKSKTLYKWDVANKIGTEIEIPFVVIIDLL